MENVNTAGKMGDIRGKPDDKDLEKIKQDTKALAEAL